MSESLLKEILLFPDGSFLLLQEINTATPLDLSLIVSHAGFVNIQHFFALPGPVTSIPANLIYVCIYSDSE